MRGTKSRNPASRGKLAGTLQGAQKNEAPEEKRAVTQLFWLYLVALIAISDGRPENASTSVSLLDIDGAARKNVSGILVGARDRQADVTTRNVVVIVLRLGTGSALDTITESIDLVLVGENRGGVRSESDSGAKARPAQKAALDRALNGRGINADRIVSEGNLLYYRIFASRIEFHSVAKPVDRAVPDRYRTGALNGDADAHGRGVRQGVTV